MKHAVMVMGFGNSSVLQETINVLDDHEIDFFIHWDKKYPLPKLYSHKSKIFFIKNRIKVNWGTDKQIIVERKLMDYVFNCGAKYDYVHLISSNDMPLMTPDYFKIYFQNKPYAIGFLDYIEKHIYNRVNEYYPIRYLNVKGQGRLHLIIKPIDYLNQLLHVDRLKGRHVEKGCNWFSMNIKYVEKVLKFNDFKLFMNTFTGDEFYIQTILKDLKPKGLSKKYNYFSDDYRMMMSSKMASRYIDWLSGKGKPYVFTLNDVETLKKIVNTEYAFCRKLNDHMIIKQVFENYKL